MDSVDLGWFLLSQIICGIGSFAIMSALFQLKFQPHIGKILIITVLESIFNYMIYFNNDIGYVIPLVGVLITFLYLTAVAKVPMLWSLVVTITGSLLVPLVIQIGILFGSFGFFMPDALKEHLWRNYALDILSGFIYSLIAIILYAGKWGFKFNHDSFRFKQEKWIVVTIAVCSAFCLPITIVLTHLNNGILNLAFLSTTSFLVFLFLLGYALKKEQVEIELIKPTMEVKENV